MTTSNKSKTARGPAPKTESTSITDVEAAYFEEVGWDPDDAPYDYAPGSDDRPFRGQGTVGRGERPYCRACEEDGFRCGDHDY